MNTDKIKETYYRQHMARKRKSGKGLESSKSGITPKEQNPKVICYKGEELTQLLKGLEREIETAKLSKGGLPDKIWIKKQFFIGINDVTRVLERMPCATKDTQTKAPVLNQTKATSIVPIQAVLFASDCHPIWLIKHIPSLAASRNVPLISVKDNKAGSLRLGEVFKMKTALAVGIKANGTCINKMIEELLHEVKFDDLP